ncbi:MAG: Glycosyl transferase family 11 [Candidatus Woesebacteria bacterium GW2011_GWB1_38_8]|uniref:Glycosyl transferase family 11 n=1 Tax=Candidatus Woesebacteria bacterium GW2011_GWB1_38_8 TaxID=1618570 RepID=A0A0G0L568_9BACT|nr:MAG: Glycosyl transferase family 11 [Candidatus Woesebacteria bacterium GW2011_GWB1_38_8]
MIIAELCGGLGNQMFQYANAQTISIRNNTPLKLLYVRNKGDTPREYSLGHFAIKAEKISGISELLIYHSFKPAIFSQILRKIFYSKFTVRIEGSETWKAGISIFKDNIYLRGFWQSERYFKDISSILRSELVPKEQISKQSIKILKQILNTQSVSIHVRRGDYFSDSKVKAIHNTYSKEYYHKAVEYIKGKVKRPVFYIFSDDLRWCEKNLKIENKIIYVKGNGVKKDYLDLWLMSKCKHNIITNSSFSWWGAWLNRNVNKIVIAPKKWFRNSSVSSVNIVPNIWIQI